MQMTSELLELASVALACRDRETLLKTLSARAGAALDARAVLVWLINPESQRFVCRARWSKPGEGRLLAQANGTGKIGILEEVYESKESRRLSTPEVGSAKLDHLSETCRAHLTSALYVPLAGAEGTAGVVEILNKHTGMFTDEDVQFLEAAGRLTVQAFKNLEAFEGSSETQLATLERLTALYDLGRTFTSTLELGELLPVVARKIRDILGADACNLWLLSANSADLYLAEKCGKDPTSQEGARVSINEGLLGEILQQASPRLLAESSSEAGLEERRRAGGNFKIQSWMAAPLKKDDEVLGVVELLNKPDGTLFTQDDLFFLSSITEQAAVALHNARLLESERKVHVLASLLKISQEITSTLDLDHVLATVVNQAQSVVPFDRCFIGYFDRGRFALGAVSGEEEVPKTGEMKDLRDRAEWMARQSNPLSADLHENGWQTNSDAARAQLVSFLEANQYNGFYAIPLRDDQGIVGVMGLLSVRAGFLTSSSREILEILANQTTVAIRNSQLYQQLPLATFLHPLTQKKQRMQAALQEGRWIKYGKRVVAVIAAFVVIPWPMRVPANVTVVPADRRIVSTIEGGVVERVFVKEGDVVRPGDVLAQLNDGEDRIKLAQAQAALESARRELGEGEFRNDPSAAGLARIRADLHLAEVQFEQKRIAEARIHSPITGIVVTPKVEEKAGILLKPGEGFAEIVGQDRMAAEMSVEETELSLVRTGRNVTVKLNAFPTRTFEGTIERIGAQARSDSNEQYFIVRAVFPNPGGTVRDGMVGRARIHAGGGWFQSGWYPAGYLLLRAPIRWLWTRLWALLP
jgi:RND family efflux transporter MFP subunit